MTFLSRCSALRGLVAFALLVPSGVGAQDGGEGGDVGGLSTATGNIFTNLGAIITDNLLAIVSVMLIAALIAWRLGVRGDEILKTIVVAAGLGAVPVIAGSIASFGS